MKRKDYYKGSNQLLAIIIITDVLLNKLYYFVAIDNANGCDLTNDITIWIFGFEDI